MFLPRLCLLKCVWLFLCELCMKSNTFITLSSPKQPQFCAVGAAGGRALLKGTLMASCWGRKEQRLFCIPPDEKLNCRPSGCLFAYLTSGRLPAHYIWIARLHRGRKIACEFNSFVIEFKWPPALIFVLHITLLQENSILSGCRCSAALMEWYLFMLRCFVGWEACHQALIIYVARQEMDNI